VEALRFQEEPQTRDSGEVPQLTVLRESLYMTDRIRDPSVSSVLSLRSHAAGVLDRVIILRERAADAAAGCHGETPLGPFRAIHDHADARIWVAE
jgi:hypothetical protein